MGYRLELIFITMLIIAIFSMITLSLRVEGISQLEPQIEEINNSDTWVDIGNNSIDLALICANLGIKLDDCTRNYVIDVLS